MGESGNVASEQPRHAESARAKSSPRPRSALAAAGPVLQRSSLVVGAAGDVYEREADAVARDVIASLGEDGVDDETATRRAYDPSVGTKIRRRSAPAAPVPAAIVQSVQRRVPTIQRWDWWDKRKAAKAAEAEQAKQKAAAAKAAAPFGGMAGKLPSTTEEVGKPGFAIGSSAASAGIASATAGSAYGAGAGSAALGPLLMGDAALGLNNARKMANEAEQFGDKGMGKLAGRKAKDQGAQLGAAAVATSKAGADIANVAAGTMKDMGATTLGAAGAGLGIAGGAAMVLQGAWRGGHAVMKLCRLTWGRGAHMLSEHGEEWKRAAVRAEKFKIAANSLKIAVGALGIAAGALLIVSNPIGWAVGLAAAIAGGVYAIGKIAAKIKNASDVSDARKKIEAGTRAEEVDGVPRLSVRPKKKRAEQGTGYAPAAKEELSPDEQKRQKAIDEANAVAREACQNARVAEAMRSAMAKGNKDIVATGLQELAADEEFNIASLIKAPEDRKLHDALLILSSINVTPEEALAPSGQELIQRKLSKAEGM